MIEQLSDHKRLAQIREMPQGADEKFLLRLIWEYEQAMRSAFSELDLVRGADNRALESYMLNARRLLRDALADKIENADVHRAEEEIAALRKADAKLMRTSDIEALYGPKRRCNHFPGQTSCGWCRS